MTDYFKTIRAYLRGKWGRKSRAKSVTVNVVHEPQFGLTIDANGYISGLRSYSDEFSTPRWETLSLTYAGVNKLREQIARLKRAKKKHSHLQKKLDDLLNVRANIADQQTENTK